MDSVDLNDYCSICNKQQNSVSNLLGKSFQINTVPRCGHKFCDDCIRREFNRKRSFLCPKCGTAVTQDKVKSFIWIDCFLLIILFLFSYSYQPRPLKRLKLKKIFPFVVKSNYCSIKLRMISLPWMHSKIMKNLLKILSTILFMRLMFLRLKQELRNIKKKIPK